MNKSDGILPHNKNSVRFILYYINIFTIIFLYNINKSINKKYTDKNSAW